MTFYRQAQSTEFTKHNDLCATEQIRAWHNGFRIVMQVNNMTYGMEVAAAGTVHQTGGVMLHGPLDNFFRLELTPRSEEHTSALQSLMRISYAVFCLKKKKHTHKKTVTIHNHMNYIQYY